MAPSAREETNTWLSKRALFCTWRLSHTRTRSLPRAARMDREARALDVCEIKVSTSAESTRSAVRRLGGSTETKPVSIATSLKTSTSARPSLSARAWCRARAGGHAWGEGGERFVSGGRWVGGMALSYLFITREEGESFVLFARGDGTRSNEDAQLFPQPSTVH